MSRALPILSLLLIAMLFSVLRYGPESVREYLELPRLAGTNAPSLNEGKVNRMTGSDGQRLFQRAEIAIEEEPGKSVPNAIGGGQDVEEPVTFSQGVPGRDQLFTNCQGAGGELDGQVS